MLERWVEGGDVRVSISSRYPLVPLGEIARQRREPLTAASALDQRQTITIHFDGTIVPRGRETAFKGAMFAAYAGDVVFSKIDARNGALGVVPAALPRVVVTSEYPVFVADAQQVQTDWLHRLLRHSSVLNALQQRAAGTSGRKRVGPADFASIAIPLPPLAEQQRLIAALDAAQQSAAALQQQAAQQRVVAQAIFEAALGFAPAVLLPKRPVFIARYAQLERWSHEGLLRAKEAGPAASSSEWPVVTLGEVIADLENGWSPQCLARRPNDGEWGVLKLGAVSFGSFDARQVKALPSTLKPKPEYEIKPNDVLISRANVTRLVGATAHVENTPPRLLLCDKIFRMRFQPSSPIDAAFAALVLRLPDVRRQVEGRLTGTSPTMKNISKPALLDLQFPLPPLATQRALVEALQAAHQQADALSAQAAQQLAQAEAAFEQAVFDGPVLH